MLNNITRKRKGQNLNADSSGSKIYGPSIIPSVVLLTGLRHRLKTHGFPPSILNIAGR